MTSALHTPKQAMEIPSSKFSRYLSYPHPPPYETPSQEKETATRSPLHPPHKASGQGP
jgi:hypothetical protein